MARSIAFELANVFTRSRFGGNLLVVFPDARGMTDLEMQSVAREFNLPEATFVIPPDPADPADPGETSDAGVRVRIFTPAREVAFAGHPTLGTAAVLAARGMVPLEEGRGRIILHERVGAVDVALRVDVEAIFAELTAPSSLETAPVSQTAADVAACLSLPADLVREMWFASVGLPFLLIHLASENAVDAAALDRSAWRAGLSTAWTSNMFFFAGDLGPGSALHARMFAPALGIDEDPATGSACAALAGVLAARTDARAGTLRWEIDQGVAMGRPSRITASADMVDGAVRRIRVAGHTVLVGRGEIGLP